MTSKFTGYRCSVCNAEFAPEKVMYICPNDGGNLDVLLDYESLKEVIKQKGSDALFLKAEPSLWRYQPLLPIVDPGGIRTPLWAVPG